MINGWDLIADNNKFKMIVAKLGINNLPVNGEDRFSLTRDFMPSAWGRYSATVWDYATFAGTIGLFVMLLFLFVRVMPAISIAEMRELVAETSEEHE